MSPPPKKRAVEAKLSCPEPFCLVAMKSSNLRRHLSSEHGYDMDKIKSFNDSLRVKKGDDKGSGVLKCGICDLLVVSKSGMEKHMREKHATDHRRPENPGEISLHNPQQTQPPKPKPIVLPPTSGSIPIVSDLVVTSREEAIVACLECDATFGKLSEYSIHYGETHSTSPGDYNIVSKTFDNSELSKAWLHDRLIMTCSTLSTRNSRKEGSMKITYYQCHHAGHYKGSGNLRVGHGTKKAVKHCTSYLKETLYSDGKVHMTACFAHAGHDLDYAEQRLTDLERKWFKKRFEERFSDQQILKEIRQTYRGQECRIFYTTQSDLRHLRELYNMHPGRLADNDIDSVAKRFTMNKMADGMRLFEKPTDSTGANFKLVIITPKQMEWIEKYSSRGVVIDDTFNCTLYNLKLTTIMVLDEKDRGLPSGFLLSGSTTTDDVSTLFQCIKNDFPEFCPSILMSDEAHVFFNSYERVFPDTSGGTQKVTCRWHVLQTWKRKLNESGMSPSDVTTQIIMRKLNQLINLPYKQAFTRCATELLSFLEERSCNDFASYLRKNYMEKTDEWASFARHGAVVHTSMHAESWHSRLKKEMGLKKGKMRADHLIQILYELLVSIEDLHNIHDRRKLSCASSRQSNTHSMHREAIKSYQHKQSIIFYDGNDQWTVENEGKSDEQYQVMKIMKCPCTAKNNHCLECGVCPYSYRCGCLTEKAGIGCKHVHAIALYGQRTVSGNRDENAPLHTVLDDFEFVDEDGDDFEERHPQTQTPKRTNLNVQAMILTDRDNRAMQWQRMCANWDVIDGVAKDLSKMNTPESQVLLDDLERKMKELQTASLTSIGVIRGTGQNLSQIQIAPRASITDSSRAADLPIRMEKRTAILARRRKEKAMHKTVPLIKKNIGELDICAICLEMEPQLPSDIDDLEIEARETAWQQCDNQKCNLWVHSACGKAAIGRRCSACTIGSYMNSVGNGEKSSSEDDFDIDLD